MKVGKGLGVKTPMSYYLKGQGDLVGGVILRCIEGPEWAQGFCRTLLASVSSLRC